jgi:hypothetical protein
MRLKGRYYRAYFVYKGGEAMPVMQIAANSGLLVLLLIGGLANILIPKRRKH